MKKTVRDPVEKRMAQFAHDFECVKKTTIKDWTNDWLCDIIRANNRTIKTTIKTVGMGKTTRLLKMRIDFCLLDENVKSCMAKAYLNSKNRLIILDNEVLLERITSYREPWDLPTQIKAMTCCHKHVDFPVKLRIY